MILFVIFYSYSILSSFYSKPLYVNSIKLHMVLLLTNTLLNVTYIKEDKLISSYFSFSNCLSFFYIFQNNLDLIGDLFTNIYIIQ